MDSSTTTTTTSHSTNGSQTTTPLRQQQYPKKKKTTPSSARISPSFRRLVFVAFVSFVVFIQIFRFFAGNNGSGFAASNSLSKAVLKVNISQRQGRSISTTDKNNNMTTLIRNTTLKTSIQKAKTLSKVSRGEASSSSTLDEANTTTTKPATSNDAQMMIHNNETSITTELIQSKVRASISSLLSKNDTASASSSSSSSSLPMPPHTLGAFIHVGKTGGSTLCSQLRNACHSWVKKPCNHKVIRSGNESHLSRFTTYYHTPDFDKLAREKRNYDFYVWTLRDPFERLLSAFTYQHPRNMGFAKDDTYWAKYVRASIPAYSCFPSMESFATAIGDEPDDFDYPFDGHKGVVNNTDCTRLARAMMHSKVLTNPAHLYYNIQAIYSRVMISAAHNSSAANTTTANANAAAILVIRTENMWNDWTTANQWLGQEGPIATFPHIRARQQNVTTKLPVTKDISALGRKRLCRALRDEYEVYFHLIQRAVNLDDAERQAAYQLARSNCPDNAFTTV